MQIIIIILWLILSVLSSLTYINYIKQLKSWKLLACYLIFIIGGPIFGINQILTALLDNIFPEGWDNDDFT